MVLNPRLVVIALCTAGMLVTATLSQAQTAQASELVTQLSKELGSTPAQAEGAAGALFGIAKGRLSADDFAKVAGAVPGMDSLLKAAPAMATTGALSGVTGTTGTAAATTATGLAGATSAFQKLGLKPEMVSKAVPILTQYVTKSGGAGVGSLLGGVLK